MIIINELLPRISRWRHFLDERLLVPIQYFKSRDPFSWLGIWRGTGGREGSHICGVSGILIHIVKRFATSPHVEDGLRFYAGISSEASTEPFGDEFTNISLQALS